MIIANMVDITDETDESKLQGVVTPTVCAIALQRFIDISHIRHRITDGKKTISIARITNTPTPLRKRFILPCIVLYASDIAVPTMGINDDKVNLTALAVTESYAVVIIERIVSIAEKTVIIKAISHLITFENISQNPCKFTLSVIEEETENPKNTLSSGAINFEDNCDTIWQDDKIMV